MQLASNRTKVQNWVRLWDPCPTLLHQTFLQNLKEQTRMPIITPVDQLHICFIPKCHIVRTIYKPSHQDERRRPEGMIAGL